MNWGSATDFFHMGGYGLYVWGSYGLGLAVFVIEPLLARGRHRRALAALHDDFDDELNDETQA
ncbi:heme exporter protein CcmD [Inhella gelatinilytica]|uniref:Heme exporter protein D n=1 Tax=Inhella gelatinilytica TaxID=2795030 RepID=A0A931NDB0_9BURK|nr:heme exporter protein CcmD [Inhella gelatinilytica]MBH9552050.1 heme exporter protein CcmD [Inhella gelatinilytica]